MRIYFSNKSRIFFLNLIITLFSFFTLIWYLINFNLILTFYLKKLSDKNNIHKKFMLRCIELAEKGIGKTYPNPLVGCVIVNENKIISEGWHKKSR